MFAGMVIGTLAQPRRHGRRHVQRRHRHGKLQRHIKFHPNWSTLGEVMTSYRFFKTAAMALQIYFRL